MIIITMVRKKPTSYLIRDIPYDQWKALKARAERDGVRNVRDLLLRWIADYVTEAQRAA